VEAGEEFRVSVLSGGVSNRTVLVERASGSWVLKQALEQLRVPVEWFSDPARVHREAAALRALQEFAPAGTVPGFVFEDRRHHVLCMEAVARPHENWKEKLLAGRVVGGEFEQFGVLLGTVHRESRLRLAALSEFAGRSFFESLRLEPYYLYTAQRVPEAAVFLRRLVEETRRIGVCLVHGDYSPKNVLVREGRVVLLDHEVAHLGDPAFDLGFSLAHLLSKARHLPDHREELSAGALRYLEAYRAEAAGFPWAELEQRAVCHTLACLLARARGRSQLEYLDEGEKAGQAAVVVRVLPAPPKTVAALAEGFLA
jgi:aminoglycoside phosphotransferase (APT) family kinase protein